MGLALAQRLAHIDHADHGQLLVVRPLEQLQQRILAFRAIIVAFERGG